MVIFYFLILVMPLSQHRIWSHFVGDMTGFKFLGMACLPYALFHLLRRQRSPSFVGTWQSRFFILLYAVATFSYFMLSRVDWWLSFWLTYTSMMILFFITMVVVDTVERLRRVVLVAIGSLGLASLYVLRDWQLYHNLYVDYRPGWVVGDPNYFSVSALLFLPSCFLLFQEKRPRWQWFFCLGCLVVTLTALMLSASRGGFLGLVLASLYVILRSKHRIRRLAVIVVGFVLLTVCTPVSPWERLTRPTKSDNDAADVRLTLWRGGMRIVQAHPLLGVGLNNFMYEVPKYLRDDELPANERVDRVAHNSYVEIAAELGLPGIFAFLGVLVAAWLSLEGVRKRALRGDIFFPPQVALGLQAGLMGAAVAIFFVSAHYLKLFWLAIFLTMCLPRLCAEAEEAALNKTLEKVSEKTPDNLPPLGEAVGSRASGRESLERARRLALPVVPRPWTR